MSERMRLLFTASPAHGHLLPLLPMIRAATRAGHDVRLATGPDLVGPMRSRGVVAHGVGPTWREITAARDAELARLGVTGDEALVTSASVLFGRAAADRLSGLSQLVRRWRPDVVVHEPLELGGVLLGRRLGLPTVTHGYGPMFREYAALGAAVSAASGDAGVWQEMLAGPALDLCPPGLRPEGPALWPGALDLRPTAGEPDEGSFREPASFTPAYSGRPLVYVTLGTIANTIPGLMSGLVAAMHSLAVDLVVTTGPGLDPADLGPQPANVRVLRYVPQELVLRRADLLVSHAGAGTMLGALCHGLPQLCLPRGADQPMNAAAVARAGAGIVIREEEYSPEAARAGVFELLSSPAYRQAALGVRSEIAAMPAAVDVLPRMLEEATSAGAARAAG